MEGLDHHTLPRRMEDIQVVEADSWGPGQVVACLEAAHAHRRWLVEGLVGDKVVCHHAVGQEQHFEDAGMLYVLARMLKHERRLV